MTGAMVYCEAFCSREFYICVLVILTLTFCLLSVSGGNKNTCRVSLIAVDFGVEKKRNFEAYTRIEQLLHRDFCTCMQASSSVPRHEPNVQRCARHSVAVLSLRTVGCFGFSLTGIRAASFVSRA